MVIAEAPRLQWRLPSGYTRDVRDVHLNVNPRSIQHLDQAIDAEQMQLAAHEITHARLRNAENDSGSLLRPMAIDDDLARDIHQIGPDAKVFGLFA